MSQQKYSFELLLDCKKCSRSGYQYFTCDYYPEFLQTNELDRVFVPSHINVGCEKCRNNLKVKVPFWMPKKYCSPSRDMEITFLS